MASHPKCESRLTRVFLKHSRHDYRLQETEAGRRFLQTLRKSHEDYVERLNEEGGNDEAEEDDDVGTNNEEGELGNGPFSTTCASPSSFSPADGRQMRGSGERGNMVDDTILLKSSLERLIVEYLKKLSPEEDFESEEFLRLRRHLMEIVEPTIMVPTADDDEGGALVAEEEYGASDVGGVVDSSNEVTENVLPFNGSQSEFVSSDENAAAAGVPKGRKHKGASRKCVHSRRVVSSLSAVDLERAHQNETENEYNIRRIINYR